MKKFCNLLFFLFAQVQAMEIAPNNQLLYAAKTGDCQLAEVALQKGADINYSGSDESPLSWATLRSNREMIRVLIARGADVNVSAVSEHPPLMLACMHCAGQIAMDLILAGADGNYKDRHGWTPLMFAVLFGNGQALQALLASGADLHAQSSDNQTALTIALREKPWLAKILQDVHDFLNHPVDHIKANPKSKDDYFVWSIAYQKNDAYNVLKKMYPAQLSSTQKLIRYFLVAARVGNAAVLSSLKNILRELKPEAVKFVCLKAYDITMKLHPELVCLLQQVLAEDIAPSALKKSSQRCHIL